MKRKSLIDVWKQIDIKDVDDCWNWVGRVTSSRLAYGVIGVAGKEYVVHRVVYAFANPGSIELRAPKDLSLKKFVLHKCDNRLCCNPKHLFLGNYDDNNKDAMRKGRKGSLTEDSVSTIRYLGSLNLSSQEIAVAFGINKETVRRVRMGTLYTGVPSGL